jgi:arachidonate 15-lipoxygenase
LLPHANIGLKPTVASLTDTIARFVYFVTVYHESVGALLWNYQLWTGLHPIRLYQDGRREPLDVYQRLVNTNYLLHVVRTPLLHDYSDLVLIDPQQPSRSDAAREAFKTFVQELGNLQQEMDQDAWGCWKLYPNRLEVNINA